MTDSHTAPGKGRRAAYERTRQAFDALGLEEKAAFLLEAAAVTLIRGATQAGRAVADEIDGLFSSGAARGARRSGGQHARPPHTQPAGSSAARPETAQQQPPPRPHGNGTSTRKDDA